MTVERALRGIAGVVVLISAAGIWLHHPYWVILTAFVGLNLLQSSFTDWCPMVWILQKAGLQRAGACPRSQPETPTAPDETERDA